VVKAPNSQKALWLDLFNCGALTLCLTPSSSLLPPSNLRCFLPIEIPQRCALRSRHVSKPVCISLQGSSTTMRTASRGATSRLAPGALLRLSVYADLSCRKSSQKPSDELYESFKASFPQFTAPTSTAGPSQSLSSSTSLTDALDVAVTARYVDPLQTSLIAFFDHTKPRQRTPLCASSKFLAMPTPASRDFDDLCVF
jgi:hypothetical protein